MFLIFPMLSKKRKFLIQSKVCLCADINLKKKYCSGKCYSPVKLIFSFAVLHTCKCNKMIGELFHKDEDCANRLCK